MYVIQEVSTACFLAVHAVHQVLVHGILSSLRPTAVFRLQTEQLMAARLIGSLKRPCSGRPITSSDVYDNSERLAITNGIKVCSGERLREAVS